MQISTRYVLLLSLAAAGVFAAFSVPAHAQIVAFGASNVSGWNVPPSQKFPAQLQSMLRDKGYTVKVLNAGVYGNTTAQMRSRMDTDIPDGTAIVILDATGGLFNNGLQGIDPAQGEADMAAINARFKARGISVIPISGADLGPEYHQPDGLHLNAEGHRLVAQALLPQVTALLGPPTRMPSAVVEACAADAKRLCAKFLGEDDQRHACMQEHRSQLSAECLHAIAQSRQQPDH